MARRDDDDDDDREEKEDEENKDDEEGDEEDEGKSKKKKKKKLTDDEKQWAMFAHLGCLIAGFVAPLIIWIMKKEESKFVTRHALEALNFSITMAIVLTVGIPLTCGIGVLFVPVVLIYNVLAGMAANRGEEYKYPMTIRFIK